MKQNLKNKIKTKKLEEKTNFKFFFDKLFQDWDNFTKIARTKASRAVNREQKADGVVIFCTEKNRGLFS